MEKAATIPVRIFDPDPARAELLYRQVLAVLPQAQMQVAGIAQAGEIVLARLDAEGALPQVPEGAALVLVLAPGIKGPAEGSVSLVRPFSLGELQDALQRALRLLAAGSTRVRIAPSLLFLPQEQRLVRDGESIALTEAETALLLRLWQAGGQEVSRSGLLRDVLHYSPDADSHALETLVWRLRGKMGDVAGEVRHLWTGDNGYALRISS